VTLNARELHELLGVGKHFRTWITDRIEKYSFLEGEDYILCEGLSRPELGTAKSRAQVTKEYYISVDMAKELSMVEKYGFQENNDSIVIISIPNWIVVGNRGVTKEYRISIDMPKELSMVIIQ